MRSLNSFSVRLLELDGNGPDDIAEFDRYARERDAKGDTLRTRLIDLITRDKHGNHISDERRSEYAAIALWFAFGCPTHNERGEEIPDADRIVVARALGNMADIAAAGRIVEIEMRIRARAASNPEDPAVVRLREIADQKKTAAAKKAASPIVNKVDRLKAGSHASASPRSPSVISSARVESDNRTEPDPEALAEVNEVIAEMTALGILDARPIESDNRKKQSQPVNADSGKVLDPIPLDGMFVLDDPTKWPRGYVVSVARIDDLGTGPMWIARNLDAETFGRVIDATVERNES
ncbi:MAG TPA: hypothetical protein VN808_21485 [Stellaceae bacterium]|nr:hypothetical protein [Stellaceae bacterium]